MILTVIFGSASILFGIIGIITTWNHRNQIIIPNKLSVLNSLHLDMMALDIALTPKKINSLTLGSRETYLKDISFSYGYGGHISKTNLLAITYINIAISAKIDKETYFEAKKLRDIYIRSKIGYLAIKDLDEDKLDPLKTGLKEYRNILLSRIQHYDKKFEHSTLSSRIAYFLQTPVEEGRNKQK